MSRSASVRVQGDKALIKALKKLPLKVQKKVLRSAVPKAATPIVKAAKKLVPLGEGLKPDGTEREHLRKTITKTSAKFYKSGAVVVVIGPRFKAAPHSHLVDKGTKPHKITLTKPWGKVPAGTVLQHPGAKAAHFLDEAVKATGDKSKAALEKGIAKGIEKEAAKLAGKGGEEVIEFALANYLLSRSAVTTLVSTRLYADKAAQKAVAPHIVYQLSGGERNYHSTGASGLVEGTILLICRGTTYLQARQVAEVLRDELDGFTGTWDDNGTYETSIDHATLSPPASVSAMPSQGDDVGFPAVQMTLHVFYVQAVPTFGE